MNHPFQVGGALLADSPVYIERKADYEALAHLRNMDYLLVIEPRQQGKTSLINHLMRHPASGDVSFAYADVTTPDRSTEAAWYQTLCPRILRQLRNLIPRDQWPAIPSDSTGWRDFLCDVAMFAADAHRRVVIALDEIGAVTFPGATEFFSVLRDVYNSRQAEPELKQLTFLLAGAFHPRDLIKDDKISPFNIAQHVRLQDFRDPQAIWDLVGHLLRSYKHYFSEDERVEQVKAISERIHYWVDGQPYLTQWLCQHLTRYGPAVTPRHVDEGVEQLRREDDNHLPPLLEHLDSDKKLREYVDRILAGERIKFYPRENRRQAQLELLGLIKADANGFCRIRTRIYEKVLRPGNSTTEILSLGILDDWKGTTSEDQLELSTDDTMPTKETLYLDTTATLFAQWLADYTRMVPYRDFPTEKGRLVLQSIRPAMSIQAPISLTMDTLHVIPKEGEDAEIVWPVGAAIAFRVIPLSSERVEVQAECHYIAVEGYFRELLAEIKQRWPVRKKEASPVSEAPPVPHRRLEPTTVPSVPQSSIGGDNMDHKRGLTQLRECLEHRAPDILVEFNTLEERFHKNERAERLFGSSENTRNEHSQIIYALNELALRHCGVSFNDLCMGKQPAPETRPTPDDREIIERLRRIEDKLGRGRTEDRQAAAQILDALDHNRVEQGEATQMVAELCTWAQTVQQAGLPLNPELRTALDALSQHTGSAYQYLQLAVPIVPGILSYNVELGSQHQVDLKAIWERIRARLGRGSKGDGAPTSPGLFYGTGNRWAVLVGVNEYEDTGNYGQLQVCVKDVHAIREQLVAGGFDPARIRLLTDDATELPTRDNILVALKAVADATERDDLLFFYYSGHGDEDGGESYLVARNGKRLVLSDTAVRLSRVKEIMEQAPARAKVIVLDACHSGADIGGKGPKPMSEEFIRRVFQQAEGLAVLASCKQGQLSYEWHENERSVFTHFLLEALEGQADLDEKGFVTVQDANRHVVNGVKLWASQRNRSQTPTLEGKLAGDIILVRYQ